jgi:hypothetical protein
MTAKWARILFGAVASFCAASINAFALPAADPSVEHIRVATMTCAEANEFLGSESYNCDDDGSDCSRGECVDIASCRYNKGVDGFTISFSYPTTCAAE